MAAFLGLLLVNPPAKEQVYQSLSRELVAIEPPVWAAMIATHVRNRGVSVQILDAEALGLTTQQTAEQIGALSPTLTVFVVYGHQPSASTQSMPGARAVHERLKQAHPFLKTLFMGTHPAALPERTLREEQCDFVCEGEGPSTIYDLVQVLKAGSTEFGKVKGLWYWMDGMPVSTPAAELIERLDAEIPDLAWDLLPMERYRAHNWHCFHDIDHRQPYVALYTSLGCPFKCTFCCINAPFGGAGIRYFSPEWVVRQLDVLVNQYGVKNIKIEDEMFVLNAKHVSGICDLVIERGYDLNIWAYARVDTVKNEATLAKLQQAGFTWLGIGIESASEFVRDGVEKSFGKHDIMRNVERVRAAGINVGANYIFGLPDDTHETMQDTLEMALELNTEWANFYCAMAYPGSPLYMMAKQKKIPLPDNPGGPGWIGYSQHAYETLPLATDYVSASEVVRFRDVAFQTYFTNPHYLQHIERRFGPPAVEHIRQMTSHTLRRKYA